MNDLSHSRGALGADDSIAFQRLLPAPIERCWAFLTQDDLRRRWLAGGKMTLENGAPFVWTWRNDELGATPSVRPEGFSAEHRMESRVIEVDPPHRLVVAWGEGDVTFALQPSGARTLLTLTHRRIADRDAKVQIAAGWHAHLDILARAAEGREAPAFWPAWEALRDDYGKRIPG